MLRYNDSSHTGFNLYKSAIEEEKNFDFSSLPKDVTDESRADFVNQGFAPAYCSPSIVDKTFFKPGLSELAQITGSNRKPVYDSLPDGSMPDYGVNIGWVRSAARDRVDIDLALAVVKETIERSQLEDAEKLKAIKDSEKTLNKLSDAISSANQQKADSKTETE